MQCSMIKRNKFTTYMDRRFVYRTVPEHKFQFSTSHKPNPSRNINQAYSQKYLRTQPGQKILFKTTTNILLENYDLNQTLKMNDRSVLHSKSKKKTFPRPLKKSDSDFTQLKFQKVKIDHIQNEKWKQPYSIIRANKNNLSHLLTQRALTECDNRPKEIREMQQVKKQLSQKKMERQIGELNRLKRYVRDKKEIISLMSKMYERQQKSVEQTFSSFRKQMEEVCQFYKHQKFDSLQLGKYKRIA